MRLNPLGQAVHGLETLALDGRVLVPMLRTTRPVWLDLRTGDAAYQVLRGGSWQLEACAVATATTRPLEATPTGANQIEAGGEGTWAAWGPGGVRSNRHPTLPLAGLHGVGRDGCLAYCRTRAEGRGIIFRELKPRDAAGEPATLEVAKGLGIAPEPHIVAFGIAAFVNGGKLHTVGTPVQPVTVPEPINQPRLLELASGAWWVCYHTNDRLLLQPLDSPVGYVVRDSAGTYAPDLVEIRPGVIRVAWSVTEAEGPSSFRSTAADGDIDLAAPRVRLTRVSVPALPFAAWTGSFFALSNRPGYGSDPTSPGTCTVIVEPGLTSPRPVIVADIGDGGADLVHEWAGRWAQVVAVYVARETSPATLTAAVSAARHRIQSLGLAPRPIIAYGGDTPPVSVGADWIAVQAYPNAGETVEDAEHRWRNLLQQVAGKPFVLIAGAFDRRIGDPPRPQITADVLERCQARYPELARAAGRTCQALLWFAANRPGGTKEYPALRPWHVATVAAFPRPTIAPPAAKTAITIARYTTAAKLSAPVEAVAVVTGTPPAFLAWRSRPRGGTWQQAAVNPYPDLDHHFTFTAAGVYDIGVDALTAARVRIDGTASERLVTVTA